MNTTDALTLRGKGFEEVSRAGVVELPAREVGEPFVDADDIADVVVAALTEDGHSGQSYEVTGPRLLTFAQAIAEISTSIGRDRRSRAGSASKPPRLHRVRPRRPRNRCLEFLTCPPTTSAASAEENLTRSTMLDISRGIVIVLATLAIGLLAGLFYSFTVAVMPGLAQADDRTFVQAMQQINIAIVNPWFLFSFLGAPLLVALACLLFFIGGNRAPLPWLLLALLFAVATFVITSALNIPLNNALDAARQDPSAIAAPAAPRANFETTWVRWNNIRTLTSTAALLFMAWALVQYGRAHALTASR